MEDLIKQLSKVGEESPALDGLMLKLEMALNSDCGLDPPDEVEFYATWEQ